MEESSSQPSKSSQKSNQPTQGVFPTPDNTTFHATKPYKALDRSRKETRLLRVDIRSSELTELECELVQNVSLYDWDGKYIALSYSAGSASNTCDIIVDDIRFQAFANLEHALRQVCTYWKASQDYEATKGLLVWADQVCINQYDYIEKGHQVGTMTDIYHLAERVVICLSAADRDPLSEDTRWPRTWDDEEAKTSFYVANEGIQWMMKVGLDVPVAQYHAQSGSQALTLDQLKASMFRDIDIDNIRRLDSIPNFMDHQRLLAYWDEHVTRTTHNAPPFGLWDLLEILRSSWWSRAWVTQEFLTAKRADFIFQNHSFSWERHLHIFCPPVEVLRQVTAYDSELYHKYKNFEATGCMDDNRDLRSVHLTCVTKLLWDQRNKADLKQFLVQSWRCKASDQRDLVYAFLGLSRDITIEPNYSPQNSLSAVLTTTAKDIITAGNSLDFLHYAPQTSWFIEWHLPGPHLRFDHFDGTSIPRGTRIPKSTPNCYGCNRFIDLHYYICVTCTDYTVCKWCMPLNVCFRDKHHEFLSSVVPWRQVMNFPIPSWAFNCTEYQHRQLSYSRKFESKETGGSKADASFKFHRLRAYPSAFPAMEVLGMLIAPLFDSQSGQWNLRLRFDNSQYEKFKDINGPCSRDGEMNPYAGKRKRPRSDPLWYWPAELKPNKSTADDHLFEIKSCRLIEKSDQMWLLYGSGAPFILRKIEDVYHLVASVEVIRENKDGSFSPHPSIKLLGPEWHENPVRRRITLI
ncbi:hypothetical protein EJ05DRAFT_496530 [Pseudovirgaria hyperparasitica]|uniref:Heterokaryon incompatibility domain-containing protein n=1 Tax=Pseudovirgaria hyperparasitica TaxID=470096 RepID=A0A6A6WIV1_9PEZI|nr:uncharacterized protein EJ05DRAFT_496530 [Pseudovirgaria hyperparasitica]KAF2761627.1 hypothetical protein EJ05DRAFT_496530 [Pseudovirgaria hyperparasitica]